MTTENTWTDDMVATTALMNNLEDTVIVQCTAATRPTGAEGRFIFETDTNLLLLYTGAAWVIVYGYWTTYSPSWTNVTVGNGTVTASYRYVGQDIHFRVKLVFGTTTSISNATKVSLPVTASVAPSKTSIRGYFYDDNAGTTYPAVHDVAATTTTGFLYASASGSTWVTNSSVSSSLPFTWTTSDTIEIEGMYTP